MSTIAGVDGCKGGWLCITKKVETGVVSSEVYSDAQSLLQQNPEPVVVAVDIPIGLTESGPRQCDIKARKLLKNRQPCVFPAPIRPALHASSRKQADEIQRGIDQKGVSIQSFALYAKIIEFDNILSDDPSVQKRVKEIHPELCFWACNNKNPIQYKKKSEEGRAIRHSLICKYFGEKAIKNVRFNYLVKEVAHDDIYDAFIALWTAERILRRNAGLIPNPSPCDEKGIHMEMWY